MRVSERRGYVRTSHGLLPFPTVIATVFFRFFDRLNPFLRFSAVVKFRWVAPGNSPVGTGGPGTCLLWREPQEAPFERDVRSHCGAQKAPPIAPRPSFATAHLPTAHRPLPTANAQLRESVFQKPLVFQALFKNTLASIFTFTFSQKKATCRSGGHAVAPRPKFTVAPQLSFAVAYLPTAHRPLPPANQSSPGLRKQSLTVSKYKQLEVIA